MEIRNLLTYIKVCETMSFSKAAEQLGYAQSTVTMQIGQLEEELGVKLFDRSGKRFRLNAKGEELLAYANQLTALEAEAKSTVADLKTPRGLLRIGVIESVGAFFLPEILEDYLACYPQVQVQVITATTREIMEMLRQNRIDLMLTLDEPVCDADWQCAWSRKEDILFLCAPSHPFAAQGRAPLEAVLRAPLIVTEKHCNYRKTFEQICDRQNLTLKPRLEIGCTRTILDFTAHNVGLTFLPRLTAQKELDAGRLAAFQVDGVKMEMLIQLIYRRSKWNSPAMEAFAGKVAQRSAS